MYAHVLFTSQWSALFIRCLTFIFLSMSVPAFAQTLTWQKQYNGPNGLDDTGVKVKSDTSGNVYVTGNSEGDMVTIKYNAEGIQQWAVRYDSVFTDEENAVTHTLDQATDLVVDASGNAYVTGTSHYDYNCDKTAVITLKYNSSGVRQWKVQNTAELFCANTGHLEPPHLATDGAANLYLSVSYTSPSQSHNRIVLQKLTPAGSQVWKSTYQSAIPVEAFGLDVDAAGNAYIAGSDTTALLLKYNPAGGLQWQKRPEGLSELSVRSDASGNAYVIGSNGDIVTIKYNAAGVQQWQVRYNGGQYFDDGVGEYFYNDDRARNLLVDASGNTYVTGLSYSSRNCKVIGAIVIKYNSQGVPQWEHSIAGAFCDGYVGVPQLATDGAKNLYVAVSHHGDSESANHITVKKLTPAGIQQWEHDYNQDYDHPVQAFDLDVDAIGNAYVTGSILNHNDDYTEYESNLLTLKYAASAASACEATGTILREYWANVPGSNLSDIPLNSPPTASDQLTVLRTQANVADSYAQRIRGYLCAPTSGQYTFFIQGDDRAELYLSTDADPANKLRIASAIVAWSWTDNAAQQSAPIRLVAGQSYYLEVLHQEGSGGDVVRVGWRTPQMAPDAEPVVIPGAVLAPFEYAVSPPTSPSVKRVLATATQLRLSWEDAGNLETGYVVERAINEAGPYARVASLPANTLSYDDSGLAPNTTYFYRVYAVAEPGASAYTEVVSGTTSMPTVLREYWASVPGHNLSDIPLNTPPTSSSLLTSLRTPANVADHYAQRIRGYLLPPTSGSYTFFIQGDDVAELFLSTDIDPENKQRIASAKMAWNWTDNAAQQSAPIRLVAGQSYYLEVLHQEGSGGDVVRVGWRTPEMAPDAQPIIIAGTVLAPFELLPATPIKLTVSYPGLDYIDLNWQIIAKSSLDHFVLERATSENGPFSIVKSNIYPYPVFTDRGLQPNTTYFYRVYTVNQYGASGYSNLARGTTLAICQETGTILREYWSGIPGDHVSDMPTNTSPTTSTPLTSLESPTNQGDNYGERIRGYVCAPQTGFYKFWIASDSDSELWLGFARNPDSKRLIASVAGETLPREWNKYDSQHYNLVYLQTDYSYYIEVLHKGGVGNDNLAVGWNTPENYYNGEPIIIPGAVLSPFVPTSPAARRIQPIQEDSLPQLKAYPNPTTGVTTVAFIAAETGWLGVEVYNLQGQLLRQLFGQQVKAGSSHQRPLDATSLPSGMYLIRMVNGKRVELQKLLVAH